MANITGAGTDRGDLFGYVPDRAQVRSIRPPSASELTTARVLCRRLRHQQVRADKMRTAHLICLNLLSMLKHAAQRG